MRIPYPIGSFEQRGIVVLGNEQGSKDALCLGCDELLFAGHEEQKVYLQNCDHHLYFRAARPDLSDLHTVFKPRGRHLLYPRIEGAFGIDFSLLAVAAEDGAFDIQARSELQSDGIQNVFAFLILSSSCSDSSLSNQQTLLTGQNSIAKQQEESHKLGAELLHKVSAAQSELESFFVSSISLPLTRRTKCSSPSLACATTRFPRLGTSIGSSSFCNSNFRDLLRSSPSFLRF